MSPAASRQAEPVGRPAAAAAAASSPDRPREQSDKRLATLRRLLIVGAPTAALATSALLLVAGLPDYSRHVAFERNAMTWVQSVMLVGMAFLAASLVVRLWLAGRRPWLWAFVCAGFLGLALDEWFIVHERIRDDVLTGLPRFLPWAEPGDVILPLYALAGLAMLVWILRAMQDDRTARLAFIAGVVLAALAVGVDTIDPRSYSYGTLLAEQSVEEVVELLAQSLMLLGLALFALGRPRPPRDAVPR